VLCIAPSIPVIAFGVWWNSNTISHNFVHLPSSNPAATNRLYAIYLSVLLGIPQTLWRDRHLAHHRGQSLHLRWAPAIFMETSMILGIVDAHALPGSSLFLDDLSARYVLDSASAIFTATLSTQEEPRQSYGALSK